MYVCVYCTRAGEEMLDTGEQEFMGGIWLFEWNAQQEQMAQAEAQQVADRQIKMKAGNLRG